MNSKEDVFSYWEHPFFLLLTGCERVSIYNVQIYHFV